MEIAILASRFKKQSFLGTSEEHRFAPNSGGHDDGSPTGAGLQPEPGSLAYFRWDEITEDWSAKKKKLLLSCGRESTHKTIYRFGRNGHLGAE